MSGIRHTSQSELHTSGNGANGANTDGQSRPPQPSIFDSESESDESQPDRRPITRIITSSQDVLPQHTNTAFPQTSSPSRNAERKHSSPKNQTKEAHGSTTTQKESQIARLVKRRKVVEEELTSQLEKDTRDEALFRYDVDKCPEHSNTRAYQQTPVHGFGETMLRAMGWKGNVHPDKGKGLKLRPARLGLGAKVGGLPPPSRKLQKRARSPDKQVEPEPEKETLKGLASEDEVSGLAEGIQAERSGSGKTNLHHGDTSVHCKRLTSSSYGRETRIVDAKQGQNVACNGKERKQVGAQLQEQPASRLANYSAHGSEMWQRYPESRTGGEGAYGKADRHHRARKQREEDNFFERHDFRRASGGYRRLHDEESRREHYERLKHTKKGCEEDRTRRDDEHRVRQSWSAGEDHPQNHRERQRDGSSVYLEEERRRVNSGYYCDERGNSSRGRVEKKTLSRLEKSGTGRKRERSDEQDDMRLEYRRQHEHPAHRDYEHPNGFSREQKESRREDGNGSRKRKSRFSNV